MEMYQAELFAFLVTYPWLKRYLPKDKEISFKYRQTPLNNDVISISSRYKTCCNPYTTAGAPSIDIVEKIALLDVDGKEIGEVTSFPQKGRFMKTYFYGFEWTFQIETLGDALLRIGSPLSERLHYVVFSMHGEYSSDPVEISVLEINDSFSLSDWEQKIKAMRKNLDDALAAKKRNHEDLEREQAKSISRALLVFSVILAVLTLPLLFPMAKIIFK